MDARGYGRRAHLTPAVRRTTAGCTLFGLLGVTAGTYGLLDAGSPSWLGLPLLLGGLLAAIVGLWLGGRRAVRTRYRPDPWRGPEWLTSASGVVAGRVLVVVSMRDPLELQGFSGTLAWPALPLLPAVAIAVGLAPRVADPPPHRRVGRSPVARPASAAQLGATDSEVAA